MDVRPGEAERRDVNWKRWARLAGTCLALAAVAFMVQRLFALEIWAQNLAWQHIAWVLVATAPVYAVGVAILAVAWMVLLGREAPPARLSIAWYLLAQFGKYLPGNVAHLAGRHILFVGVRVRQSTLLAAATVETGLLLAGAATIALVFSPVQIYRVLDDALPDTVVAGSIFVLLALGSIGLWLARRSTFSREKLVAMGGAFALHLVFFILAGGILVGLAQSLGSPVIAAEHWRLIIAASAAAWLCGFVVPGAPGGLGIRESVLVLLLSQALGSEPALLIALAYRGATILGDSIAALTGAAMAKRSGRPKTAD